MLESPFNKIAGSQLYLKETPTKVFSCDYCEVFKSNYFEEHLRTAASEKIQTRFSSSACIFKYKSKRRKRTEKNKCLSQIFLKRPKMIYSKRTIHTLNLLRSFLFPMFVSIRKPLALTTETVSRRCSVKRVKRRFQRFCRTHWKIPAAESIF